MNIPRRKELEAISELLSEARDRLETVKDEEEEYLNNIPENLQGGERYDKAEDAVYNLDTALDHLMDALDAIEEASA